MCGSGIFLGGFPQKVQDTHFRLWIWKFIRGVAAKLPYLLCFDDGCSRNNRTDMAGRQGSHGRPKILAIRRPRRSGVKQNG
jgi:hypothetical protein